MVYLVYRPASKGNFDRDHCDEPKFSASYALDKPFWDVIPSSTRSNFDDVVQILVSVFWVGIDTVPFFKLFPVHCPGNPRTPW